MLIKPWFSLLAQVFNTGLIYNLPSVQSLTVSLTYLTPELLGQVDKTSAETSVSLSVSIFRFPGRKATETVIVGLWLEDTVLGMLKNSRVRRKYCSIIYYHLKSVRN